MEGDDVKKLLRTISRDKEFELFIAELFAHTKIFQNLLTEAREFKTPRFDDFRILAFKHLDAILPFVSEGGEVQTLNFGKKTFAEWDNNLVDREIHYIGHFTPDGFIGVAHSDSNDEAYEVRRKRDCARHAEKKQIVANVVGRAILTMLTAERIQPQVSVRIDAQAPQSIQKIKTTEPKIKRRRILRRLIISKTDFSDRDKVKQLCTKMDDSKIPVPPRKKGGLHGFHPETWDKIYKNPKSAEYKRLFESKNSPLLRDLYGKNKN